MASEAKSVNEDSSSSPKPEMNQSSHETATDPVPCRTDNAVQVGAGLKVGRFDSSETTLEECFYKHLISPVVSHLEAAKHNVETNSVQTNTSVDGDDRKKKQTPDTLPAMGQSIGLIMGQLEERLVRENHDGHTDSNKFLKSHLRELHRFEEVALLSQSFGAYISTLELPQLRKFTESIVADTTRWISSVFRFPDSGATFHKRVSEGVVRACRLALHQKYPRYGSDGYEALYSRPPVIYMSHAARPGIARSLCSQLGLPLSSIHTVSGSTEAGSDNRMDVRADHRMDVRALVKCIEEDVVSGRNPVMLVAQAGTQLLGEVDRLDQLMKLCQEREIWLHVEGNNLATLALTTTSARIQQAKGADSITLDLGGWLGLPFLPHTTLYKTGDHSSVATDSVTGCSVQDCLPLWICMQNIGHEAIVHQIASSVELAKMMHAKTEKMVNIQNVVSYEVANPMVVFRYEQIPQEVADSGDDSDTRPPLSPKDPYYDALNVWLAEIMRRDVPKIRISTVEIETVGVCLRYVPLECAHVHTNSKDDMIQWIMCLDKQIKILDATVRQRADFQDIVEAQDNLRLITLRTWAGLGSIQYLPEKVLSEINDLSEGSKKEINEINIHLVHQLKSADTAFSLGHSEEGLACARFGLITEETDLEELIALVYTTGKEMEESSKFLETMAEIVRDGIDKASKGLYLEEQNKLAQEGVIRQIPLVSSFVNWWSPPAKADTKGRMFNLASGKVESTEKTYECHMQVQEVSPDLSPGAPRQYPRKSSLKPRQHRNSSTLSSSSVALPESAVGVEERVTGETRQTDTTAALTPAEEEVFEDERGKTA